MLLTSDQHRDIARRDQWYFDVYFGLLTGDNVVFTGDGVDDLDSFISRLETNGSYNFNRDQKFLCDVGNLYSDFRPFDLDDVRAIRTQYVLWFGDTAKPNVYASGSNTAFPVPVISEYGGSSPQTELE